MKKIGLIINPVAGMGGSVGLKGSDHVLPEALRRGAVPKAEKRAAEALGSLLSLKDELIVLTCPGKMGEDTAKALGFRTELVPTGTESPENVHQAVDAGIPEDLARTAAPETIRAAGEMKAQADEDFILMFAGGDGTARDIYNGVGTDLPCIGVPAGVKIHSPVYAKSPRSAGEIALRFVKGENRRTTEQEVLDINEDDYRQEKISTSLYGYLTVPNDAARIQNRKEPTPLSEAAAIESIAVQVTETMEPGVVYLIGAGTTTRGIMRELNLPNTLIGVDMVKDKKLVASDVYGSRIMELAGNDDLRLIVTVTGGQGFLFGRGNQQLTPEVLRKVGKEHITIIATQEKLAEFKGRPLLIDTGDEELNKSLSGWYRVISGYGVFTMCRAAAE